MVRMFDDAWGYTCSVGSAGAYTPEELKAVWDALMETPEGSSYCEVGCSEGRSTSLIMQAAIDKKARVILIDSFEEGGPEAAAKFMRNILPLQWPFVLSVTRSESYGEAGMAGPIFDLVHIDGGHEEAVVLQDCKTFLPAIKLGGFVVFHDYGNDGLLGVKATVDTMCNYKEWEKFNLVNHCLILRRVPRDVGGDV